MPLFTGINEEKLQYKYNCRNRGIIWFTKKFNINIVADRILPFPPSVISGEECEAKIEDFDILSSSNLKENDIGKLFKVRHKLSKNTYNIASFKKEKNIYQPLKNQIEQEIVILYKIGHPNIAKMLNHFEDDDYIFFVLEFSSQELLLEKLKLPENFDERLFAQYIKDVASVIEYLHSLTPPIIDLNTDPANIFIDISGAIKVSILSISKVFNIQKPDYLAPEKIKKDKVEESVDYWNIGVFAYELLAGKPPFEASSQEELFDNITGVKVKFHKDFPKLAKDLITRLLKVDPKERLKLNEIKEHVWFHSRTSMRTTSIEEFIKNEGKKYEILSVTHNPKQSAEGDIIDAVKKRKDEKDIFIEEISLKYQEASKEVNDLKIEFQMGNKELEAAKKENEEIKEQLLKSKKGFIPETTLEIRRLNEEMQKLKMQIGNREELISELENKRLILSENETKIKVCANEIEIEKNANNMLNEQIVVLQEKKDNLEKKFEKLKNQDEEMKKEKKISELSNKLRMLQMKVETKMDPQDNSEVMAEAIKSILEEIKEKTKTHINRRKEEESIREELLAANNKLMELKAKNETDLFELQTQLGNKLEELKTKYLEKKRKIKITEDEKLNKIKVILKNRPEVSKETNGNINILAEKQIKDLNILLKLHNQELTKLKEEYEEVKLKYKDAEYQYDNLKKKIDLSNLEQFLS